MPLSVNTNVTSLAAQRRASLMDAAQARSIARLASGLRINGAADDAAGLAIAERMTASLRGMSQAIRNINDAGSLPQVADGAMAREREPAAPARAGGTGGKRGLSTNDRATLQQEAVQLLNQLTQIGQQPAFNGEPVFAQDTASIGGDARRRAVHGQGLGRRFHGQRRGLITTQMNLTNAGTVAIGGLPSAPPTWPGRARASATWTMPAKPCR